MEDGAGPPCLYITGIYRLCQDWREAMKTLILVESPTKARAVAQHVRGLWDGPVAVRSTAGHLRDLPEDRLGVDTADGFAPQYVVRKHRSVSYLRPYVRRAERVVLATDPDREGEAIAWHVTKVFKAELRGKTVLRATFHALTREAVREGLRNPRPLDRDLVRAAVARRVVDRLIGYHLSPRLWAAMEGKNHGLGRVQAAALALLAANGEAWEVEVEA
ncbi:MAG: hypothetical protein D6770_11490 [Anaerolineae bacterium]|nr:MAG: hypothetical protein D6770_11490 [Anaerolineae bacterium]